MHDTRRLAPIVAFGAVLIALLAAYRDSFASLFNVWHTNSTFSHGYLILPISAWLAWQKRAALAESAHRPSWLGIAVLLALVAAWVVARGAGVIGPEHFAVVAMIPALVLALLGRNAIRILMFPLAYLIFAVPIGHALVPMLMQATADVATWMLQLTGVPVHRTEMYISIPGGNFQVARACSGLNYFVTGTALGALYSYLTYSGWRKRLLSMAAFVVIPVVANGLRVYFTILVSYLTHMRFGPGEEHVWFGRVFFIFVMLVMFWVGRRWHDENAPTVRAGPSAGRTNAIGAGRWFVLPAAVAVLFAGPAYLATANGRVEARLAQEVGKLQLPSFVGWQGPDDDASGWVPRYGGARVQRSATYRDAAGKPVDVFVGLYGIGTSGNSEMISYQNTIFPEEREVLVEDRVRTVALAGGKDLKIREQAVRDSAGEHLVWYWFLVGKQNLTDPYSVKAHEALAFITLGAVTERVVTLSTPIDGGEQARLESFVELNAACVSSGFAFEECGQ